MERALEDLNTSMLRAAAAAAVIGCLIALVDLLTLDGTYALGPQAMPCVIFVGITAWVIEGTVHRPLDRRPVRALTAFALATLAVEPWLLGPLVATVEYPPVWQIVVIGIVAGAVAFGLPTFALIALLGSLGVLFARWHQGVSLEQSSAEGVLTLLTCAAAGLSINALNRATRHVTNATIGLWQVHELAATERLREVERSRMDAIVHDRVLAALLLAGRGQDNRTASQLASQAIGDLQAAQATPAERETGPWPAVIETAARGLGLEADVRAHGTPAQDRSGEAITAATLEALRNVARHSGQHRVVVHARFTPRLSRVTVSDPGSGFDVTAETGRSTGLSTSIRSRIEGVGGHARVTSAPGQGTRVVLSVPRAADSPTPPPTPWGRRQFLPVVVIAGLAVVCHLVIGQASATGEARPWPAIAAAAAILVLLVTAWTAPHTPAAEWLLCVATLVLIGVLAARVHDPARPDWQWWFVGAFDGVVAAIAFRFSGRAAMLTAAAMPLVMITSILARGLDSNLSAIADTSMQLVVVAILAVLLRRGLGRARSRIGRLARASFEARSAELAVEARSHAADERREALGAAVIPMLRIIADGELTPGDRAAAIRLEAAVRDLLVARRVMDDMLAELLDRTRRRGVRVELAVADQMPAKLAGDLRRVLMATLPTVPDGSLVRATWHQAFGAPDAPARVVLILPDASDARGQLAAMRTAHVDELVDLRNDDELLILTVLGAPITEQLPCTNCPQK